MARGLLHAAVPPLRLLTTPAADVHTCRTYEVCTLLIGDLKVLEFFVLYWFFYPPRLYSDRWHGVFQKSKK